jgi:hypothetical protein
MSAACSAAEHQSYPAADPFPKQHNRIPWADGALALLALLVFGTFLMIAVHHLRDRFQLDYAAGVFAAMAQEVRAGRLYPDLHSGELCGGTRYMPLPFALHAATSCLTGDYLLSGKLLALSLGLVLLAQVFCALRRLACPGAAALGLAALVLASGPGFMAATTIRGDLLPVVLQLAALAVMFPTPSSGRAILAGSLCALAMLAKVTAVWAGIAILIHLLARERRAALWFAGTWAGVLAGVLGTIHLADGGRMRDNFAALSGAGVGGIGALARAPLRLLRFMSAGGSGVNVLFPLAFFGCWLAWRERRWSPCHTALAACLPVLLVIYSDMGTVSNHLLDLVVLCILALGALWARSESELEATPTRPALAFILAWCLLSGWVTVQAREARTVMGRLSRSEPDTRFPARPVADHVGSVEAFLADDAWVAVTRGRRPVILDPYSLARAVQAQPTAADGLVRRIERLEFAKVILTDYTLDPGDQADTYFLGAAVQRALRENYRLLAAVEGYRILVPFKDQRGGN